MRPAYPWSVLRCSGQKRDLNEEDVNENPFLDIGMHFLGLSWHADVERMDGPARRRYLGRRLSEIEWLIQFALFRQTAPVDISTLDLMGSDREVWEKIMDLNYLEASRQAILQALADLSWPAGASWSDSESFLKIMEGARSRGPIARS
jgi:hypothetical protein